MTSLLGDGARIQEAAGINVPCPDAGKASHKCSDSCHLYGFHGFRYAHARYNYQNPDLQNQMGHACPATPNTIGSGPSDNWPSNDAYVPDMGEQRKNGKTNSE